MWRVAGEQQEAGGGRGAELVEDGSQRVHGARTESLSLSRTHVSELNFNSCIAAQCGV